MEIGKIDPRLSDTLLKVDDAVWRSRCIRILKDCLSSESEIIPKFD